MFSGLIQYFFGLFFCEQKGSEGKKGNTKARYCCFTAINCKAEARMYQKS